MQLVLQFFDAHIDVSSLLWLFPITFMFHDFEEILTVEKWGNARGPGILKTLPGLAKKMYASSLQINTHRFAQDVLVVYSIIVTATLLAAFFQSYFLFLAVLHLYFLHVFTHIGQALLLKMYTPGVATAIVPVLPYSLYAYYRLMSEGIVGWSDMLWGLAILAVLLPFCLLLLLKGRHRSAPPKR